MIDLELFFKEKPAVPDWFKTHPIFKEVTHVNKIFPSIGLSNFSVDSELENNNAPLLIRNACNAINAYLYQAKCFLEARVDGESKINRFTPALTIVDQLYSQLYKPQFLIAQFPSKKGLYLQKNILDSNKKVFAKQGESLFKVYAKIASFLHKHHEYNLIAIDSIPAIKEYSSNHFGGKMKIIFSSDGIEGAWDILTMSQRGISSCQSWNGQYKNCTIGSVIDPFTAILYMTSGSPTEHGVKMIRRCIVRFAVDSFTKRPCLFLEYMYPGENAAAMKAFKEAIRSKVGDRFAIISQRSSSSERYYVPYSEMSKFLLKHSNAGYVNSRGSHNYYGIFPYRDTFMEYKIKDNNPIVSIETCRNAKLAELGARFSNETDISNNYISVIKNTISSEIFDKVDSKTFSNNNQYIRQVCIKYFANKNSITKSLIQKIETELKVHKDKSILIPGVQKIETPLPVVKKNAKTGKPVKAKVLKIKPEKAESLDSVIESKVVSIISDYFKKDWLKLVKQTASKVKPKSRSKK